MRQEHPSHVKTVFPRQSALLPPSYTGVDSEASGDLPAGDSKGSHQAEQLEAVNPAKRRLGVTVVLPFAKSLTL